MTSAEDPETRSLTHTVSLSVDALFLANAAERPRGSGLLYALGGGWTRCWPGQGQSYPLRRQLNVVLMIRIPWGEANREHEFVVSVRDGDERTIATGGAEATGTFKVGRDVDLLDGMSQVVTAVLPLSAELAAPGIYHIVADIDGTERKRIQFEALAQAPRAR